METRMNRSDVDMMLGIAPCQDCDGDVFPAMGHIRRQLDSQSPVVMTTTPNVIRYGGRSSGKWAQGFDACTVCDRSDRDHHSFGLCNACYMRRWHRNNQERLAA